jgi:hypothetical protein
MGRDKRNENKAEHFTKLFRGTLISPAWRALPVAAKALYPCILLEWRGPRANNNGKIRLALRQAADMLGVQPNTAGRAFHALQEKGFIVVTSPARLGLGGEAKGTEYELTELAMPGSDKSVGRKLFLEWQPGHDFPVHKVMANNPLGTNGKSKPCLKNEDSNVFKIKTVCKNTSQK